MAIYLGLDVGGTKCAAVIGDQRGAIHQRTAWASRASRGPEPMIRDLVTHGRALLDRHGPTAGVGVAIGGPLDAKRGVILSPPNLPGWDRVPLRDRLGEALGAAGGVVRVEHDAAACALAEHRWGAGRDAARLGYLTCGTGFGLGLVFDGRVYRGAHGRAGEIGRVHYRDRGPVAFGRRGCFEAYAAAGALGSLAAWRFPERWPTRPTPRAVAELAAGGDARARAVIALNARAVGDACVLAFDLLRLDVVLLGSLARYLGQPWVAQVRRRFVQRVGSEEAAMCRIEPAGLAERLQDCSALAAAMGDP